MSVSLFYRLKTRWTHRDRKSARSEIRSRRGDHHHQTRRARHDSGRRHRQSRRMEPRTARLAGRSPIRTKSFPPFQLPPISTPSGPQKSRNLRAVSQPRSHPRLTAKNPASTTGRSPWTTSAANTFRARSPVPKPMKIPCPSDSPMGGSLWSGKELGHRPRRRRLARPRHQRPRYSDRQAQVLL